MCEVPRLGVKIKVTLSPEAASGTMTIIETENAPGFGPPLHRHREMEIFRVLEGRYLFEVDGNRFYGEEGDTIPVPGGVSHGFLNVCDHPSRQLVVIAPGLDAIAFFTELQDALVQNTLSAFGARWGVDFLGPPLSIEEKKFV